MRILVLTDLYPPHFQGGYELACSDHTNELMARGHQVLVLTSTWGVGQQQVSDHVHRILDVDPVNEYFRQELYLRDRWRLRRRAAQIRWFAGSRRNYTLTAEVARRFQPDIVSAWNLGKISVSTAHAAQRLGVPVIYHLADYWLLNVRLLLDETQSRVKAGFNGAMLGLPRFSAGDFQYLLFVSRALEAAYLAHGFDSSQARVIPLAVKTVPADAKPLRDPTAPWRLMFAARLVEDKGPDVALRALSRLVTDSRVGPVILTVVGAGTAEYTAALTGLAQELGVADHVEFTGKLSHQATLDRLREQDIFLFTSRWSEPFGMTIVEAMAAGVPVVATAVGAAPEIISDGVNGLLAENENADAIAACVRRLMDDAHLYQTIQSNGIAAVQEHYTITKIVDQFEAYVAACAAQGARP